MDVSLGEGEELLVVDAWINDLDQAQEIQLTRSAPYFDSALPAGVSGALVYVTDGAGERFDFKDSGSDGIYTWLPTNGSVFGQLNESYILTIELDGRTYTAVSQKNRVMPVDSIVFTFEEESLGDPEGYYGEFYARDIAGLGDTYWIKTYKNGVFLNKPEEINIAYDASFSAGSETDGIIFITPIRAGMNRVPDSDSTDDNSDVAPWMPGDKARVEIHAITNEAFDFLEQTRTQTTLGNSGIFAEPLSNVSTNIVKETNNGLNAVGFFNVASVRSLEAEVTE